MRDPTSPIKSMSGSLGLLLVALLLPGSGGQDRKEPVTTSRSPLALPEGVLHEPDNALSPALVLEPRPGRSHLLHVRIHLPGGQQLQRLRLLAAGPGFEELASRDMSRLDGGRIQEEFEIPVGGTTMKARHVLVIADYDRNSYGAAQALPNF